jgi:hypothetical protein
MYDISSISESLPSKTPSLEPNFSIAHLDLSSPSKVKTYSS